MTNTAGIDWAWGQPSETALDTAGVKFAARYLCSDRYASKRITAAETARHLAAGRAVVLVWEDSAGSVRRGQAGGVADAAAADAQCRAFGLPGCPVYFACDYDAPESDQALINAYLDGAASVIGRARTGLYGGYWPLSRARAAGKAAWLWGTRAWSGSNWATCGWQPHIMQGITTTIGGVSCDWDVASTADYGQYPRPGAAPGPDWTLEAIMALPTLTEGDRDGSGTLHVHRVQWWCAGIGRWNNLGPFTAIADDGVFGPATTAGVQAVQRFFGLTDNGVVDADTWTKLIGA